MILDTRWAEMVEEDPKLLVELMVSKMEMERNVICAGEDFIQGMRYALELLNNVDDVLIKDSFTLFGQETSD